MPQVPFYRVCSRSTILKHRQGFFGLTELPQLSKCLFTTGEAIRLSLPRYLMSRAVLDIAVKLAHGGELSFCLSDLSAASLWDV